MLGFQWLGAAVAMALLVSSAGAAPPLTVDQGIDWKQPSRDQFYVTDQGSRLIPYAWLQAMTLADGTPFLAGGLARYGYLPNDHSPTKGLPVGFLVAKDDAWGATVGMNCAACHTRQIEVKGQTYRIDGGPGLVDFQGFLTDLHAAAAKLHGDDASFAAFAYAVLGANVSGPRLADLKTQFEAWYAPFDAIIGGSLNGVSWGVGRLDAISMIFNRVAGLDIGTADDGITPKNIVAAAAPVRYPFLWNASRQDTTQWPGFAQNGSDVLGLARNTGEVLGVFAKFRPRPFGPLVDFGHGNSVDLAGLWALEGLIRKIGPPAYPAPIDTALARRGHDIFRLPVAQNGCGDCHVKKPGALTGSWLTPLQDTGTDSREWTVVQRTVDPGVLSGQLIPLTLRQLKDPAPAIDVLKVSVIGGIAARLPGALVHGPAPALRIAVPGPANLAVQLKDSFALARQTEKEPFPYESRVLEGIWAAAPYLHNGSVPTLADLLLVDTQRPTSFVVGPAYDLDRVGLAANQTAGFTYRTTGCGTGRDSGNSNCGHNFGVGLSADDKAALLEYLKQPYD